MTDCDYFPRVIPALTYLLPRDYDEEKGKERKEKDNEKTTLKKSGDRDLATVPPPKKKLFERSKVCFAVRDNGDADDEKDERKNRRRQPGNNLETIFWYPLVI
jgi:hypothetical protein